MPDKFSKEKRSQIMASVKSKGTKIELRMKEALESKSIAFEYQPKMFGRPDFLVIPNITVFCDSSFWHGRHWRKLKGTLPKEYWQEHIAKNIRRDKIVNKKLRELGYSVLRYWEEEIEKDTDGCLKEILEEQSRLSTKREHSMMKPSTERNIESIGESKVP